MFFEYTFTVLPIMCVFSEVICSSEDRNSITVALCSVHCTHGVLLHV